MGKLSSKKSSATKKAKAKGSASSRKKSVTYMDVFLAWNDQVDDELAMDLDIYDEDLLASPVTDQESSEWDTEEASMINDFMLLVESVDPSEVGALPTEVRDAWNRFSVAMSGYDQSDVGADLSGLDEDDEEPEESSVSEEPDESEEEVKEDVADDETEEGTESESSEDCFGVAYDATDRVCIECLVAEDCAEAFAARHKPKRSPRKIDKDALKAAVSMNMEKLVAAMVDSRTKYGRISILVNVSDDAKKVSVKPVTQNGE